MVAANAPDVDVLSFVGGEYFALAFRRGPTHGWPALIVLTGLVAVGVLAWDRWVRRARDPEADPARPGATLLLAGIGVATHPTLDWMNVYGMRWGLPFDPTWSYGDALFIIDPWIWLALGGVVFLGTPWARVGRTVWATMAALATVGVVYGAGWPPLAPWLVGLATVLALDRAGWRPNAKATGVVCAAVTVYVGTLAAADGAERRAVADAAIGLGLDVVDVVVAPRPASLFRSDVELVTPTEIVPGTFDWLAANRVRLRPEEAVPRTALPTDLEPQRAERVVEAARRDDRAGHFLTWSRLPWVRVTAADGGWDVRFGDARYDDRPETGALSGVTVRVPHDASTSTGAFPP